MTRTPTPPAPVSLAEFDATFEAVKNWGRWGPDDRLGTLNHVTPDTRIAAAGLVRVGESVSCSWDMRTGRQVFSFPDGEFSPIITDGKVVFLIGYSTIYQMLPKK